ncbi:MAG: SHOCT domain-containing protein [Propionicimonas sp.]|nr:SHOCT domain-containing protein [Propionicimonas sp.]
MGLLRTAARASVAANVVGNVQRRQHQRWAAEDAAAARPAPPAPPAPAAPAASTNDLLDQLTRLGQLRDTGVLSEAEFDSQKQRILAGT